MAGFDADEVTAVGIVSDGRGGDAKEKASATALAIVVEVESD